MKTAPYARQPYPTAILRIDYPIHQGKANPFHGWFFFVGSIPAGCYDREAQRSMKYETEDAAVFAAVKAGAKVLQATDCSFVDVALLRAALTA